MLRFTLPNVLSVGAGVGIGGSSTRPTVIRRAGLVALMFLLLGLPGRGPSLAHSAAKHAYRLVDVGTFGGPQADVGNSPSINDRGVVVGTADTSVLDPFGANESDAFNGDPYVQHAYSWRRGTLKDLGALGPQSATNSSYTNAINARGHAVGLSDDGAIDPRIGKAETHAVLWRNDEIVDLGTLGGNESQAFALNDRDWVVGLAANAVPDAVSMLGWGTQARAFLWHRNTMKDLGTLGGPDSFAWAVNSGGQVAGVSYTTAIIDPDTGQPPIDAFLWHKGKMRDLGNLGGSVPVFGGVVGINDRGDVTGQSNLAGNQTAHPYLWNGKAMIDLGTLGGASGSASAINERGVVVGIADLADQTHHGFLWTHGHMQDLPPVNGAPCSNGSDVNSRAQAVGNSTDCHGNATAVLWKHGSPVDLNTLVAPSTLYMTDALSINNRGQIIGEGVLPSGDTHNFVLIPAKQHSQ